MLKLADECLKVNGMLIYIYIYKYLLIKHLFISKRKRIVPQKRNLVKTILIRWLTSAVMVQTEIVCQSIECSKKHISLSYFCAPPHKKLNSSVIMRKDQKNQNWRTLYKTIGFRSSGSKKTVHKVIPPSPWGQLGPQKWGDGLRRLRLLQERSVHSMWSTCW